MAALSIRVVSELAPITTQMNRFVKGVEHLYYAKLFAMVHPYSGNPEPWRGWLRQGFSLTVREPPPAGAADRVTLSIHMDGKAFDLEAKGANSDALSELEALLKAIDTLRVSLKGMDDEARANALEANNQLRQELLTPLLESLNRAGVGPEDVERFVGAVRRGLIALTDDEISSVLFLRN